MIYLLQNWHVFAAVTFVVLSLYFAINIASNSHAYLLKIGIVVSLSIAIFFSLVTTVILIALILLTAFFLGSNVVPPIEYQKNQTEA